MRNSNPMTGRLLVGLLLALLLVRPALATPKIESWRTANGARVLFVAAPDLPMVNVRVVFDAGSARDAGKGGLAELTNALLSDGAGDWDADQIAERLESVGAELGAGSARDMAWVTLRTLTEKGAYMTAVETLAAVLTRPTFEDDDLERNRKAMLTSLRLGEQKPGTIASRAFYAALYGDHPYASPSDGTRETVSALTRDDVVAFYKRYYVAGNAVIAIVGALDRAQAGQLAEQLTGALPAGEAAPALPPVPALAAARQVARNYPSTQTHILIGQPGVYRGDPDYFPLYVGNHVLGGGGLVSLLNDEVREQRGLAYSVYSYFSPMRRKGPFILGAQTKNSQAGETLRVMLETLRRFREQGPTAKELKAAKQNITGGFPLRIASNGKIVEYLAMIGFYDLPLDYLDRFVERVEAVTAQQIRDAFQRRVDPQRLVTVIVGNGKASQSAD